MMANRCNLLRPDLFDFFQIHVPNKADITSQHITSDLNRLRTSANTHIFPVVEQVRHRRTFSLLSVCLFVLRNFLEWCCFPRIKLLQFKELSVLNECFVSGFCPFMHVRNVVEIQVYEDILILICYICSALFLDGKTPSEGIHQGRYSAPLYQTLREVCMDFLCSRQTIVDYFQAKARIELLPGCDDFPERPSPGSRLFSMANCV